MILDAIFIALAKVVTVLINLLPDFNFSVDFVGYEIVRSFFGLFNFLVPATALGSFFLVFTSYYAYLVGKKIFDYTLKFIQLIRG